MNITEARRLYTDLKNGYGLNDWKVEFNNNVSRAGVCNYDKKTLFISKKILSHASDEQIKNTMLHEIAHALEYEKTGTSNHGWRFQNICHDIGCKVGYGSEMERDELFGTKYDKWTYTCQGCGQTFGTSRKMTTLARTKCARCHGRFTEKKNF